MIIPYLTDPAKLIITGFFIHINIYQYLTNACQYLVNASTVKEFLIGPDQYLSNSYKLAGPKKGFFWIGNCIKIQNPLNSTEYLGPNKKAERYSGFKYSIFYKWILIFQ